MRYIQKLLGHKKLKTHIHILKATGQTTEVYTHITINGLQKIPSLLDGFDEL